MSKSVLFNNVRIIPRETDFLNRNIGSKGDVFFEDKTNTLRLYDGVLKGGYTLVKDDLSNVDNTVFANKAQDAGITASIELADNAPSDPLAGELWFDTDTGVLYIYYQDADNAQWVQPQSVVVGGGSGGSSNNTFSTISVVGQSPVIADSATDTLNLVAGANVTISTNPNTDTITISAQATEGGDSANSFATINADTGTTSANSSVDTLTVLGGTNIGTTINGDELTIDFTGVLGSTTFSGLTDVAGLSIDKIYMPAIAMLEVTNNGVVAYNMNSHYSGGNPTIYAISGTTLAFNLDVSGHPFAIQDVSGVEYNTGLVHVSTSGVISTGANAQQKTSGTLYWKIPASISGTYRYQCTAHSAMVGQILVKSFATL